METIKILFILCLVSSSFVYAQNDRIKNELLSQFKLRSGPSSYLHSRCGDIAFCTDTCMMLYKIEQKREECKDLTIAEVHSRINSDERPFNRMKCSDDVDCIRKCARLRPSRPSKKV